MPVFPEPWTATEIIANTNPPEVQLLYGVVIIVGIVLIDVVIGLLRKIF